MKILLLCNLGSDYGGNFISSIEKIVELVNNSGGNVYCGFLSKAKNSQWIKRIKCEKFFFEDDNDMCIKVKKIIEDENINLIHTHFVNLKKIYIINNFCKKNKIKMVCHWHMHEKGNSIIKRIIKSLYLNIFSNMKNICVSNSVKSDLFGFSEKFVTIYNGIDIKRLALVDENLKEKFLNYKEYTKILMFGGYNHYTKGLDIICFSLKYLLEKKEKVVLFIPTSKINDTINFINNYINFEDIKNNIVFLPPTDKIATYYKNVDVFVSPSREETFCTSLDEASYCSCKCIATNIPGQNENRVPSITWLKSDDNLHKILAEKILFLKNKKNNNLDDKIYIENNLDVDVWAQKIFNIYREALNLNDK